MGQHIPVITIDGLSGSGKGTIASRLAEILHWHCLDSGALYRTFAWAAINYRLSIDDQARLVSKLKSVDIQIKPVNTGSQLIIFCDGIDVTTEIRTEECSNMASRIAAIAKVRALLLPHQRAFRQAPGLVADGRDMGTVVFPDATVKFYLEATLKERAKRRYNQLKEKGINVSLPDTLEDLAQRDIRDQTRSVAPAKPAPDVIRIDTTKLSIEEVLAEVKRCVAQYV